MSLHIHSNIKEEVCWWTVLWPELLCNCYSMKLSSITQPLVLIIYAKCWRIKKPWSSSGRLPEALDSSHDLCFNTGWQKKDSSLPKFLLVSLELTSICLKWLHETTRRCQRERATVALLLTSLREGDKKWAQDNWRRTTLWSDIMVRIVRIQLIALIGCEMITLKMKTSLTPAGKLDCWRSRF